MDFLRLLAEHRTPLLDVLFQFITLFAQETIVVAVICWFYWGRDKNLAYTLGFTYFISGLTIQGLKVTFRIPVLGAGRGFSSCIICRSRCDRLLFSKRSYAERHRPVFNTWLLLEENSAANPVCCHDRTDRFFQALSRCTHPKKTSWSQWR